MIKFNKLTAPLRTRNKIWGNIKMAFAKLFQLRAVKSAYGPDFVSNISDLTFRKYIRGGYGFFFSKHLAEQIEPFVFIDIGANQGLYSILAANNKNCARAFAFEPASNAYRLFLENVKLNGQLDKIQAFNVAIADDYSDRVLYIDDGHSGAASLTLRSNKAKIEKIRTVDSRFLNEMVISSGLRVIVKIDVEGHEKVVLDQLVKTKIWADVQQLFIEIDDRWLDSAAIIKSLSAHGFIVTREITGKVAEHYDLLLVRSDNVTTP